MIRMWRAFPYWDMGYLVAVVYTVGAAVWVINGCFTWLPIAYPKLTFENEETVGVGATAFVGAISFEIGAYLALLEAINDGCFHGSAMRRILEGNAVEEKQMVDAKVRDLFYQLTPTSSSSRSTNDPERGVDDAVNEATWWRRSAAALSSGDTWTFDKLVHPRRGAMDLGAEGGRPSGYSTFQWWFTWHTFHTHHKRQIGFLACLVQFIGATLFLIPGTVALPFIYSTLQQWQLNVAYWIPQIIASAFFIVASLMFVYETQDKWYKPAPGQLGWWIGILGLAGSIGFEMCGALGPAYGNSKAVYQMGLSSLWGSCCFLVSSVLQWYDAVNKPPVVEYFKKPRASIP